MTTQTSHLPHNSQQLPNMKNENNISRILDASYEHWCQLMFSMPWTPQSSKLCMHIYISTESEIFSMIVKLMVWIRYAMIWLRGTSVSDS